jgi:hypothetical protein
VVRKPKSHGGCDMRHPLLCAVLFIGLFIALDFIALDDAAAVEAAIDDTKIELVAPPGHCPLDKNDWPDSLLMDFTLDGIKKQGERLAYLVDCERARTWHEGGNSKDVGDIVDYQASQNFRNQNVTSAKLEELCATLRKDDDSTKGWLDLFLKAFKGAFKGRYGGAEDTTLAYLVLAFEDEVCYVFSSSMMKNREQVYTVSALTILKNKLVTIHISKKFGNMDLLKGKAEDVIIHLLATARETATVLTVVNK